MQSIIRGLFLVALIHIFTFSFQKPVPPVETGYYLDPFWPQTSIAGLSQPSGIDIDTSQNIVLFNRTGRKWTDPFPDTLISRNTIMILDNKTGRLLNSWGADLFIMPHGLTVDHDNNVWVTDVSLQEVFKFSHEGKLLMKLGLTRETGSDSLRFNQPTDVAVAKDGTIYISDGYVNSRIVKYSPQGKYIGEWGKKGNKPGEFNVPHGIDIDQNGNVYVADRQNDRVQVFDKDGKLLKVYTDKKMENLYSVSIDPENQHLLAIDYLVVMKYFSKGSNIMEYDTAGNMLTRFGRATNIDAKPARYHDITVDKEGSIYVTDILGDMVQKYKKSGR